MLCWCGSLSPSSSFPLPNTAFPALISVMMLSVSFYFLWKQSPHNSALSLPYFQGLFLRFWTTWASMQCLCLSTQTGNLVNSCTSKLTYLHLTSAFKVWGRSSNRFSSSHLLRIVYALFMFIFIWMPFFYYFLPYISGIVRKTFFCYQIIIIASP